MDLESLREYLRVLAHEGYAATDGVKSPDGSATITHTLGPWRTKDTYFGGEPYGGSEVVFHEERPVWMMVYYGAVDQSIADVGGVYRFLKKALADTDADFPLRGAKRFVHEGLEYANEWHGDLDRFTGSEWITSGGRTVYSATYAGGLVDQRGE